MIRLLSTTVSVKLRPITFIDYTCISRWNNFHQNNRVVVCVREGAIKTARTEQEVRVSLTGPSSQRRERKPEPRYILVIRDIPIILRPKNYCETWVLINNTLSTVNYSLEITSFSHIYSKRIQIIWNHWALLIDVGFHLLIVRKNNQRASLAYWFINKDFLPLIYKYIPSKHKIITIILLQQYSITCNVKYVVITIVYNINMNFNHDTDSARDNIFKTFQQ